jgi:hypothetical protein
MHVGTKHAKNDFISIRFLACVFASKNFQRLKNPEKFPGLIENVVQVLKMREMISFYFLTLTDT